jgi:hypothetical protein
MFPSYREKNVKLVSTYRVSDFETHNTKHRTVKHIDILNSLYSYTYLLRYLSLSQGYKKVQTNSYLKIPDNKTVIYNKLYRAFHNFSVITDIYNKKIKGPTLMELFTATKKPKFFLNN